MHIPYATASRIKEYEQCQFKYFLNYHLQYPPLKVGNIWAEKGNAVHVALEKWTNAKLGRTENASADYRQVLLDYYAQTSLWTLDNRAPDKGHTHPVAKSCESCPLATKDGRCEPANVLISNVEGCPRPNFLEDLALVEKTLQRTDYNPFKLDANGALVAKVLGVEQEFITSLGGVPVKGYMDLVIENNPNTLEVIDYKTGKAMSYDAACKDPQVRIYAAVARQMWPQYKYIMVTLHYLKTKPVTCAFDEKDDGVTLRALHGAFNRIDNNDNPERKPIWLCRYCIGWDDCTEIHKEFKKRGKFVLPTITCSYSGQGGPCWGSIYAVVGQSINPKNIKSILYACGGHAEIFKGGGYVEEAANNTPISGQDEDLRE
jgi:RecB family exonuclease